ncbi:MAG: cation transporter [Candidatus Thiodiazotropha taylori]|nr:cation transporter [Candidatus Thiodiazotropha taylori]MCG7963550.1 cation transporter [Candidatus Thiodiazotropha endolucinida]MCG7934283.1 cation transporter [Candidatus Thiodiazotropha taylori]MCG7993843.1 cation transporter [Candidatus Thiodiazotropha taylori]MCG8085213.1 cation transporter [Candidatus Thiodiazotropha taylori]
MQNCCSSTQCTDGTAAGSPEFRKALWIALIVNLIMFNIEVVGGLYANSVSLLADAVDFAGDAANYALSLSVLSLGLLWRARAALIKGMTMGAYGLLVVGKTVWATLYGTAPEAYTMGLIGLVALVANLSVAVMLYRFRDGDANMRSVWLCSRNDSIVNLMIILAALGVLGTETRWPDLIVAAVVSGLAISSAISIVVQARHEIATAEKTAMSLPVTVKIDESK